MAKDKEKPVADEAEGAPKKGKRKLLIIIVAVVVLLAGGGGAAWYFLHAKKAAHEEGASTHEAGPEKPPVFVKLDSFTVNLVSEGEEHMLQADIELKVADVKVADMLSAHRPEIRSALLLLLSSKSVTSLASVEGKQKLTVEIKTQINKVLHVKEPEGVSGVFFTSFVIQ